MRKLTVTTRDRQRIAVVHYANGHSKAILLCHGFFNNKDVVLFRGIAERLAERYDVFTFDFRGHGKSSGLFTWTSRENNDIKAVLDKMKSMDYEAIGLIGFSLGAALGLIEAAHDPDIKTVIAVSAPFEFWEIDFHFWEPGMWGDLKLNLGHKGMGKGVLPGNIFEPKIDPIDIIAKISPRPVLFVHGAKDWLIKPRHSKALFRKASRPKKLVIIPKGGHAEMLFDETPDVFMKECLDWFAVTL